MENEDLWKPSDQIWDGFGVLGPSRAWRRSPGRPPSDQLEGYGLGRYPREERGGRAVRRILAAALLGLLAFACVKAALPCPIQVPLSPGG